MDARAYETILASRDGAVATIALNVPDRKNPLGPLMVNELLYALDDARDDADVRVVVLTGAGSAFSAGGDLKQMSSGGGRPALALRGDYVDLLLRFTTLGKPTIARIPGVAMGGGLGLVASCDFAVAAESAMLGTPEIDRGLFPMMIMAVLGRIIPRRDLLAMMLLGEKMTARRAVELGLLSEAVPDAYLDTRIAELAGVLAKKSPTAMRMGLDAYHAYAGRPLEEALPHLRDQLFALLGTEDAREGIRAFMEKRDPVWTGR